MYLLVYTKPYVCYESLGYAKPLGLTAHIAAACYTFHYPTFLWIDSLIQRCHCPTSSRTAHSMGDPPTT
uniref:Uncharacterized protein n=1 Tax=Megaselia scalaris TaxID=36166 RepID=T1GQD4_MEGSC